MHLDPSLDEIKKEYHGNLKSYMIGFIGSLIFTFISFYLVWTKRLSTDILLYTIITLCLAQAILQIRFFMHLGKEDKPRWESISFFFMISCVLIIVGGTLWIMFDLNNRVMSGMSM